MTEADIYNMSDVFISYSRKDSDFVHRLFDDIKATDKEVWADFEDIPKAADWWEEIKAGIDAADAFVFIISPDSVQSDVCRREVDHAVASNKRLLPVLYREITDEADKAKVHPSISSHNWIFFREHDDYDQAFNTLLESLETDLEHNRTLTRLLVRAKEWQDQNKAHSYLLQGDDLEQADDWLSHSLNKSPAPTNLHAEYITASRSAETNRQRRLFTYAAGGMVVALLLAVFSIYQMYDAQSARDAAEVAREQAEVAREEAVESEQEARAVALSASSAEAMFNNNPDLALVLARAAVQIDPTNERLTTTLAQVAYSPGTSALIPMDDVPRTAVYAQNGSSFAAGFISGRICQFDGVTYEQITCLSSNGGDAHSDDVLWIHMNINGTRLLSSGADERLVLWDVDTDSPDYGTIISEITITGITSSAMTNNATVAVFGTNEGVFGRWDMMSDTVDIVEYQHGARINVIALNPSNDRVLAGTENGVMLEYSVTDLTLTDNYVNPNNLEPISSVAYHPDDAIAFAGDEVATLTAWDLNLGSIIRTYQGHGENVTAITFSNDGRTMFSASWDNSIFEWDISTGRIVQEFYGHSGGINALSITADDRHMVSGGFDSTMRVWLVRPTIFDRQLLSNDNALYASDWNNTHVVAANDEGEVFIFDRTSGDLIHEIEDEEGQSGAFFMQIHPNNQSFVVAFADCSLTHYSMRGVVLWASRVESDVLCRQVGFRPNTNELLVLSNDDLFLVDVDTGETIGTIPYAPEGRPNLRSFAFTADGTQMMLGNNNRTDNLLLIDVASGAILRTYQGHTDGILTIDISADGSLVASGSFDNNVRVWDFASGDLIWLLEGHSDRVLDVDFSPDGNSLVSTSNDTTMRLWEMRNGIGRMVYRLHTNRVVNAHFSPDGTRILTASHDSTLIIWRFPQRLGELQQWISQNRYLRELSCGERNLYLSERNVCE